ncbi:dsDNA nuclease domain-containing protein [Acidovorax temperans]|jgi:hypothetical protein|uniref:dsDNA nuclease domain-containing protein n=1 Tax=Acidovorax temperans TaxID=80878 RepID=UPI000A067E86|nr:dsDNA nuclease domain-containing protein [Acidovorax temperans]
MTANTLPEPPLQKVLTDLFHDFEGDEIGGRHAIKGFSFQVWLAVLEALRAHRKPDDYAVVLEWQQDIALLNSSTAPTTVRFVQLKKNESTLKWTLPSLLVVGNAEDDDAAVDTQDDAVVTPATGKGKTSKKPKKPKPSILAKLYVHRRRFAGLTKAGLVFASDAPFEVPKAAGGTSMVSGIPLNTLPVPARNNIEKKIRAQLDVPAGETIDLDDFELLVTDCPVVDPHKFVAGECAEMQLATGLELSGKATLLAVLVIASYVNLRAASTRHAKNFNELLQRAVTRAEVTGYLAAANDQAVPTSDHVQSVIDRLNAEIAPPAVVRQMRREMARACVQISDRTTATPMIASRLKDVYTTKGEYPGVARLTDMFETWYRDLEKRSPPDFGLFRREYLYCLMAMIYEDANPTKHLPPVPADPQPENAK